MTLVGNVQLVTGDASSVDAVVALLESEGHTIRSNPDVYVRNYAQFYVEDARELRDRASSKALGDRRIFILTMHGINAEAQNMLLKTLEEAPGNVLFIFIHPAPETLLPTVRSRAQMLHVESTRDESSIDARTFIAAQPAKRLEMLKPLLEKGDDDKRDIGAIVTFLSSLERMLGSMKENTQGLESVYRARKYLADRGSLVKPLLEQVALLVPTART